jgi:hypothetical protein
VRLCRVVEKRHEVAPGVEASGGIGRRSAALKEQMVLHALDARERVDTQLGKAASTAPRISHLTFPTRKSLTELGFRKPVKSLGFI